MFERKTSAGSFWKPEQVLNSKKIGVKVIVQVDTTRVMEHLSKVNSKPLKFFQSRSEDMKIFSCSPEKVSECVYVI